MKNTFNKARIQKEGTHLTRRERFRKWMAKLKSLKVNHGKSMINKVDQLISHLIIQHWNKLLQQGIVVVTANVTAEETVNISDSNNQRDYVDLETVGGCVGVGV